ncbi:MAG: 1-(5-phosphoribosyl)-5-[(5-phosphoribosylamino)methylideneamino]imidazole-4-carboxamide isomerase [Candidatus Omnitrophica bacterium]|nr:1-(5-phosphoribosyl)-5-[(5-phosphoribosylamino)methylideneamino]imidazole-4-carboxamide isomerase [Candidatus Omnitrophota bacterium]
MILIPAIDILGDKVVRLLKGEYDKVTVYSDSPDEVARMWESQGAECIHVVDLDAAKEGRLVNLESVAKICQAVKTVVQYGGGVRSQQDLQQLLTAGVDRIVLGTSAFDSGLLKKLLKQYGEQIVVSVDSRNGFVRVGGWTNDSHVPYMEFCKRLEEMGVASIVFTDIERDGTLQGPNREALKEVLGGVSMQVIASGGVASPADVEWFMQCGYNNLYGVITGKALYEKKIILKDMIKRINSQTQR